MPKTFDAGPLHATFEKKGEAQVRTDIATLVYTGQKKELAQAWLETTEQKRSDIYASEQIEIARDSARSARVSAEAAERSANAAEAANKRANLAIIVAVVSVVVTITIGLVSYLSQTNGG